MCIENLIRLVRANAVSRSALPPHSKIGSRWIGDGRSIQRIAFTSAATRFASTGFASLPSRFKDEPTITPSATRR
jgi:2-iminoacetate synthase ThiH